MTRVFLLARALRRTLLPLIAGSFAVAASAATAATTAAVPGAPSASRCAAAP